MAVRGGPVRLSVRSGPHVGAKRLRLRATRPPRLAGLKLERFSSLVWLQRLDPGVV